MSLSPRPTDSRSFRDIVVIGASAGGADAVAGVLRQLPADIPAAVFVVVHQMPNSHNYLADMLNTAGPLLAKPAEDGEAIRHGVIYVAPSDRHLLVRKEGIRITRGPRENRWRPAIDPLFRSAAVAFGPRTIGIVLSGMLDDGTAGLMAIDRCGGVTIVQEPEEAPYPDMPRNALANVPVDHRLLVAEMGSVIEKLVTEAVESQGPAPRDLEMEAQIAESGFSTANMTAQLGELTALSCPECSGPLWQQDAANTARYRCRVGHVYSAESMLSAEEEALEASLWAAVRLFDQRANVLTTLAEKDRSANRSHMVEHHCELAEEARAHAKLLRRMIVGQPED